MSNPLTLPVCGNLPLFPVVELGDPGTWVTSVDEPPLILPDPIGGKTVLGPVGGIVTPGLIGGVVVPGTSDPVGGVNNTRIVNVWSRKSLSTPKVQNSISKENNH